MNKPDKPETGKPDAAGTAPKPKKKHTALKVILIILGVIVALGIAAAVSAYAYYRHVFNQIILPETVEYVIPPSSEFFETDEPWWEIETDPFVDTEDTAPPATEPSAPATGPADPVSGEPATDGPVTEGNPDTQGGGKTTKDTGPVAPVTTESGPGATEPSGTVTDPLDTDIGDTDITEPPEPVTDEPCTVPPDTEPPAPDTPEITGPDETEPPDTEPPASDTEPPAPDTEPGASDTAEIIPPEPVTEPPVVYPDVIPTVSPTDVVWPSYVRPINDGELINIMLIGQDNRTFSERSRSDSMILLSVNLKTGGISMISFMRDLYVQLGNGYSDNRLNVAYQFGGFPLLFDAMKRNFGITCDYGVVVNFSSFEQIINTLGGVDLSFTQAEVDYLISRCKVGRLPDGTMIKAGLNRNVPSDTALAYARIRKIDSDFTRTGRQRALLLSVYNRFRGASLRTVLDLVGQITDFVRLYGMTSNELLGLVVRLYPLLGNEITNGRIPGNYGFYYAYIRKMSVLVPDLTKLRNLLETMLPLE
ncbi:MAG: LCP family protein [Clostridia bacterium]|nr:LCP family protein [Clostridia bacterium]